MKDVFKNHRIRRVSGFLLAGVLYVLSCPSASYGISAGGTPDPASLNRYMRCVYPPVASKSNVFQLPFIVQHSLNKTKNDPQRSVRHVSRVRRKLKTRTQKKRRTYRITRRTVRRLSALPSEQAEKLARLKMTINLVWPIRRYDFWISSPFGRRKMIGGECGFHAGIDMAAVRGIPVRAAASGKVVKTSVSNTGYGNMILIEHDYHMTTRYAHLHRIKVVEGQYVEKGDVIGTVGNTGNVRHRKGRDGSHLHFEVYVGKKRVNPLFFLEQ